MTATARSLACRRAAHRQQREVWLTDVPPVSAETRRRVALLVCGRAGSVDEARFVLDALGLLADPVVGSRRHAGRGVSR
ncbi:MAG TPA: hypothetical protein VNG13_03165 [Mycobacteriales bacterium]|nr:hypothetical protein [Mycobacteriales bacterium]